MRILKDEHGVADQQIFNLGNPKNFVSVRDLATMLIEELSAFPAYWSRDAAAVQIVSGPNLASVHRDQEFASLHVDSRLRQWRAQVVRYAVGEGLQFGDRFLKPGRALHHLTFQFGGLIGHSILSLAQGVG